jgi:acetyl esterase/lipase
MKRIVGLLMLCAIAAPASAERLPVRVVKDITYQTGVAGASGKDRLDLYLPQGKSGAPVVVWYYGGALQEGDKSDATEVGAAQRFAAAGIATAVVNYRLSPGVSHPAHIQDAAASFAWVKRHIAEYGGDPDQVFVVGHSAGAYLLALLATDERYLAAHGLSTRDIRGLVPVSAFFWVERTGVAPDRPKTVWGSDASVWADASPAHHLRAGLPPMLILYADGDEPWRQQQNEEFERDVRKAGNARVGIVRIAGRTHMSILNHLKDDNDPASNNIVAFVNATSHASRE